VGRRTRRGGGFEKRGTEWGERPDLKRGNMVHVTKEEESMKKANDLKVWGRQCGKLDGGGGGEETYDSYIRGKLRRQKKLLYELWGEGGGREVHDWDLTLYRCAKDQPRNYEKITETRAKWRRKLRGQGLKRKRRLSVSELISE